MSSIVSVITPSDTYDLTVVETVRREFGAAVSSMSDDHILELIHQASGACARFCDRVFASEEVTEDFWNGGFPLYLSRRPVTQLLSITEGSAVLDSTGYRLDYESGRLWKMTSSTPACWSTGLVSVTYVGGYELLDTLPYELERACISTIRMYMARSSQTNPLLRSEEIPGVMRYEYQINPVNGSYGDLPPDAVSLLRPFVTQVA